MHNPKLKIKNCEFPDDLLYDVDNDVWLRMLPGGRGQVGVTTVFSFLSGWLQKVSLKTNLTEVARGRLVATAESPRHFSGIRTPVSGKIRTFNLAVQQNPRLVNASPYGEGWIVELETFSRDGELAKPSEAKERLESRIKELRVHCFAKLPDDEIFAIGLECSSVLAELDDLLSKRQIGTVVHVLSNDPFADIEMVRWADQRKQILLETSVDEDNFYHFLVEKKS